MPTSVLPLLPWLPLPLCCHQVLCANRLLPLGSPFYWCPLRDKIILHWSPSKLVRACFAPMHANAWYPQNKKGEKEEKDIHSIGSSLCFSCHTVLINDHLVRELRNCFTYLYKSDVFLICHCTTNDNICWKSQNFCEHHQLNPTFFPVVWDSAENGHWNGIEANLFFLIPFQRLG